MRQLYDVRGSRKAASIDWTACIATGLDIEPGNLLSE